MTCHPGTKHWQWHGSPLYTEERWLQLLVLSCWVWCMLHPQIQQSSWMLCRFLGKRVCGVVQNFPLHVTQAHTSSFHAYLYIVLMSLSTVHQFHMSLSISSTCHCPHLISVVSIHTSYSESGTRWYSVGEWIEDDCVEWEVGDVWGTGGWREEWQMYWIFKVPLLAAVNVQM